MNHQKYHRQITIDDLSGNKSENNKLEFIQHFNCPKHLSIEAQEEWNRIIEIYSNFEYQILSQLDINALEIYCELLVTYRKAMLRVREGAEVYRTMSGPKINPWLKVANDAAKQIKKYGEILMLDPISRLKRY